MVQPTNRGLRLFMVNLVENGLDLPDELVAIMHDVVLQNTVPLKD